MRGTFYLIRSLPAKVLTPAPLPRIVRLRPPGATSYPSRVTLVENRLTPRGFSLSQFGEMVAKLTEYIKAGQIKIDKAETVKPVKVCSLPFLSFCESEEKKD